MGHGMLIAIDPGLSGAIACLTFEGEPLWVVDLPHLKVDNHTYVDTSQVKKLCYGYVTAIMEKPYIMPRQRGADTIYMNYGRLTVAFKAWKEVAPRTWKKALGLGRQKDASLRLAREHFPTMADRLTRKKDDGRAEALLIGLWYLRFRHNAYGCKETDA